MMKKKFLLLLTGISLLVIAGVAVSYPSLANVFSADKTVAEEEHFYELVFESAHGTSVGSAYLPAGYTAEEVLAEMIGANDTNIVILSFEEKESPDPYEIAEGVTMFLVFPPGSDTAVSLTKAEYLIWLGTDELPSGKTYDPSDFEPPDDWEPVPSLEIIGGDIPLTADDDSDE